MRRATPKDSILDDIEDFFFRIWALCIALIFFYVISLWFTDRSKFYRWLAWGVAAVVGLSIAFFAAHRWQDARGKKRFAKLLDEIRSTGQEDYLKNFLSRFGFEGKETKGWGYRNHKVDWYRINDLEKYLLEKGVHVRIGPKRDIYAILRHYIEEKEENLTRGSIAMAPQKFSLLSGTDFEKLLYRLFEAMGYQVERTGRTGDQGGDLIANKNGERILIQAKCYRDWSVGNAAVQQVTGAMKYYDCNKSMVVTTSAHFTPSAHILAKANSTELISKERLSEMLMQYLGESWV